MSEAPNTLMEAVAATLDRLGERTSARGFGAMALAARIVNGDDTGSALAALHKELRYTLDDIERTAAPSEEDPIAKAKADLRLVT